MLSRRFMEIAVGIFFITASVVVIFLGFSLIDALHSTNQLMRNTIQEKSKISSKVVIDTENPAQSGY